MKNMKRVLALVLCLLLAFPAAIAQEAAYVIGEPTNAAFADAFAAGKLVGGTLEMDLALDAQMLGIAEEEQALLAAVMEAIAQSKLSFGAGLTGEGLRVALGVELTDAAGENPVAVSVLADVTLDGIAVQSDMLPGKRVNVKWETLLALCGMSEADIEMVMSLKELDPEAVMAAIEAAIAELEPMIEMALEMAMPYVETVVSFALTLPMEVRENLNEEGYPPTATELSVTITEKDMGTLMTLLCDQLEQDSTLMVFGNALLQEADAGMTAEEIIAEVRAAAAEMTGTDLPVSFFLGMNEDGVPLYGEVYILDEPSGENLYGGLFFYQDADGVWTAEAVGGLYDAENNPLATVYVGGSYQEDPADQNVCSLLGEIYVYEGETPLMEMVMTVGTAKTEGAALPAYDTDVAMSMYVDDGGVVVQAVCSAVGHQEMTAAGGEYTIATTTTDVYMDDVSQTQTETVEQMVEPTADGGVTGYTKISQTMPASGVEALEMLITYTSEEIDLAASKALEQVAIEEMTEEQMNALLMEVLTVATEEKLPLLMTNVPAPLLEAIVSGVAQ